MLLIIESQDLEQKNDIVQQPCLPYKKVTPMLLPVGNS